MTHSCQVNPPVIEWVVLTLQFSTGPSKHFEFPEILRPFPSGWLKTLSKVTLVCTVQEETW
jgi:hypothetical protein